MPCGVLRDWLLSTGSAPKITPLRTALLLYFIDTPARFLH